MITVHCTDNDDLYVGQADIPERFPGQGLPAQTYHDGPPDAPLPSEWHRWQRQTDNWVAVEDHRGRAGWLADGTPHMVAELGPLPDGWSDVEPVLPLARVISAKQAEIRDGSDAALAALAVEYGAMERQTWDQQYAEAEEMRTTPDALAPLVRAIAAARGMDVVVLAARIRANRDAWVAISGHVVGQRLAYQDALDAAAALTDEAAARAAIAAIVPVYTLPG